MGNVCTEAHGAALFGDVALTFHEVDDWMRRLGIEFKRVRTGESEGVSGVLDRHDLQTEAKAEARNVMFSRHRRSRDLAFHTTLAKAAGNDDAVERTNSFSEETLDFFGLDPVDLDVGEVVDSSVVQRFNDGEVRIDKAYVLADEAYPNLLFGGENPVDEGFPLSEIGVWDFHAEVFAHEGVESFVVEDQRNLVQAVGVSSVDHTSEGHVAQTRDLALQLTGDGLVATTDDGVGLNTATSQLGDRVLSGLGLLLA